jgi:diacylglycerol kinase (ATP)
MTKTKASTKTFVVLNPVAGERHPARIREGLERYFSNYQVYETTGEEHIPAIVRKALNQQFKLVIAAGGDGTVSGVAGGLVYTDVPLGIIPTGTGNMLARGLGIPLDVKGALELLTDVHRIRDIDGMQIESDLFVLNISIGVSSAAMGGTDRQSKRRFGLAAYIWTILKQLLGFQPHRFSLVIDDRPLQVRAMEILIANGALPRMTDLPLGSDVAPDDGRLDLFILLARTALDYLKVAGNLLLGRQGRDATIRHLRAQRDLVIDANRTLPVQADGDVIGQTPVHVRVVNNAVKVIVPPD